MTPGSAATIGPAGKPLVRAEKLWEELTIAGDSFRRHYVKEYAPAGCAKPPPTAATLMISKCANPQCSKLLMRLDGGRFFGFPTSKSSVEHFWLCMSCSKSYTLKHTEGKVELVARRQKTA